MANLLAAAVFFVGIHLLVSGTILRDKLMATIGEKPYLLTFSLTSLGGFIWMIAAYRGLATDISFWTAPNGLIHLGPIFISLSFVLAIAGLTTPNPTSVQSTGLLEKETAVGGIITVTRHPFQWAVVLWATYHVLASGQLSTTIFFGSFALLSLFGAIAIDKKRARVFGEKWQSFADQTSNVPFVALVQGRTKFDFRGIGWVRILVGAILYCLVVYFHNRWFGVSPMPGIFEI